MPMHAETPFVTHAPLVNRHATVGEPCAGEPLARFGGRGGRESFSTPIGY